MGRFRATFIALTALIALFSAAQLRADSMDQFTYTSNGNTYSWQLPASPTVSSYDPGGYFELTNVSIATNGGSSFSGTLDFYNSIYGGGMDLYSGDFSTLLIYAFGPVLYSGNENLPTFNPGTYKFVDFTSSLWGNSGTLVIKSVNVPEPSVSFMLVAGILALGVGLKLKKAIA